MTSAPAPRRTGFVPLPIGVELHDF